jgi:RHH-type rel operon transcriptional repressor/antitoxin RelB
MYYLHHAHYNDKEGIMTYSIRLPEVIEARLEHLATQTGRSKKFYVMQAIERQLDDLEDIYLAEKRLEDARAGRSKAFTLDEVERDLGLAD